MAGLKLGYSSSWIFFKTYQQISSSFVFFSVLFNGVFLPVGRFCFLTGVPLSYSLHD